MTATLVLPGSAQGPVLAADEPLSFWGGVDPATGTVIDVHHPLAGQCLTGAVLVLPGTRGSCSGSGVVLDLALSGRAPAALVFSDPEDVATLGALIAGRMFGRTLPVIRLSAADHARLARAAHARITPDRIETGGATIPLTAPDPAALELTETERAMLDGRNGEAAALAMDILAAMAAQQGARRLIPVTRAHIDGCIYASPANLTFARRMADLGAQVRVPTTTNAISVDRESWRAQGVPPSFGGPAQRLADAYVEMGCRPSFTCAPYQHDPPARGEVIGWSESNAVIHANSVLGARTAKHPDFLDLCIAVTGRAPETGVYLDENRAARRIIDVSQPPGADDAFWPLLGWLAGERAPDRIPLIRGVAGASADDLRALCAAFGTTSAAPMLHVDGVTPEAHQVAPDADRMGITAADLAAAWRTLNDGPEAVELVAIGSPHASAAECRALAGLLDGPVAIATIVTLSRRELDAIRRDGTAARLEAAGVQLIPDLCWCSISEPVFPPATRTVMTNSGKYAHYGPGLSGRALRFGSLADCARAARSGRAPRTLPDWLG
ncbi:aconitase X [Paracoccus sphaerophysae]|uniref:cis-3-hydroxy-L-proline dehydratase n=1 Tax=Paracoccus sphaerophysae TaxID=690417 RepID=UPI002352999E|nr:aconitase X [Paracoccus sphaerophysae]